MKMICVCPCPSVSYQGKRFMIALHSFATSVANVGFELVRPRSGRLQSPPVLLPYSPKLKLAESLVEVSLNMLK